MDRPAYIYVLILTPLVFFLAVARLLQVIKQTHAGKRRRLNPSANNESVHQSNKKKQTCRIVAFLGSGGHTGEMTRLLYGLDFAKYTHRTYLVSSGDNLSLAKARDLEAVKSRGKQHGEGVGISCSHPVPLGTHGLTSSVCLTACRHGLSDRYPALDVYINLSSRRRSRRYGVYGLV